MPSAPVQFHIVALDELALSVAVPPTQIAPLLVEPLDKGVGLTVTTVVYTVEGAQPEAVPLLTVNE